MIYIIMSELQVICEDMIKLMMELDQRMSQTIKRHESNLMMAFRKSRDKIVMELRSV